MDFKKKLKAVLVAILSFVMVFTAMPLVSHADDQSAGENVTGDATYNVEWRLLVVTNPITNTKKPVLRMHLVGGGHDVWGKDCRQVNGNIYSRNAVFRDMSGGHTLVEWLNELEPNPNFSNIGLLHHTLLDFNYPQQHNFDWNYSDCYAVWTAEINNHPEFVFEDARTSEIAIEIDLESLQKPQGGFDVYCSYDDDGIEANEIYQSKRYSDTTWDNGENRYIGLPEAREGYHWELIWAGYSSNNWGDYRTQGASTAVAWTLTTISI